MPRKKNINSSIYIFTSKYGHREEMLFNIKTNYEKVTLVTRDGEKIDKNHIIVKVPPNPTGILNTIGLKKLKKLLDKYLYFPSASILYVNATIKILQPLIEQDLNNDQRVVLITCTPPHGNSLLGFKLKKIFPTIHWITDWQDLWSYDETYFHRVAKLHRNRLLNLEKEILDLCDLNITTNIYASNVLREHYHVAASNIKDIGHPYNPQDFETFYSKVFPPTLIQENSPIKIGFLGILSKPPKVPGDKIIATMLAALDHGFNIQFHIYGDPTEITKNLVDKTQRPEIIIHERTSHMESLKNISECDFLLLTLSDLPNCNAIMHAKLPHYLILNKPILAFVPENSFTAYVINKTQTGFVIPSNKNWNEELEKVLTLYLQNKVSLNKNEDAIMEYSWKNISKLWTEAINCENN